MAKIGSYNRSADGYYHTRPLEGKPKTSKHAPCTLSERAIRSAEKRESDAEVCRRCTKKVCKGSARCIEKERARQEKERLSENGKIHDQREAGAHGGGVDDGIGVRAGVGDPG